MKYYYMIFIFFIIISEGNAQNLSGDQKDSILTDLQSDDYFKRSSAILDVLHYNIPEALPVIEEGISRQDPNLAFHFLLALEKYNSDSLISFAHYLINVCDTLRIENNYPYSRGDIKIHATRLLFKKGDYSTFQYVFDFIEQKKPHTFIGASAMLADIIKNVPGYEEPAKIELLRISLISDTFESGAAFLKLVELYGAETIQLAEDIFMTDTSYEQKKLALNSLLKYQPANLIDLLTQRMISDQDLSVHIAIILLTRFSNFTNYSYIIKNLSLINSENDRTLIQEMLSAFDPSFPDSIPDLMQDIDYLLSMVDSCSSYSWIGNDELISSLKNELYKARNFIVDKDSVSASGKINLFKQVIDEEYEDSVETNIRYVNIWAWNYLSKLSDSLLLRLPAIPEELNYNIKLLNTSGNLLTGGSLQYYEEAWKDAVNNGDGTFLVNTSQAQVSLRMTYEYGTQTLSNVSLANGNVAVFQTINTEVKLQDSNGSPIDTGTVQYYAGAWHPFGTTINGSAYKELLPNNYSFRITYANSSNDKQQNIGTNPTVTFQTVNAAIELRNSTGTLMDAGTVQYYAGAWRPFGTTTNGSAYKELLPNNYSFRMTYANASNDKQQNIGANPTVTFQTVNAAVELRNSTGTLMDAGTVQYYAGAWREFGNTTNGIAYKELLPNNYSFRMTYANASNDKQQNIGSNPVVVFQTVNTAVELRNSSGTFMDAGTVQYYAGAWREFGNTTNGIAYKELLPNNYSFRMTHEYISNDKQQNIGANNTVTFSTIACKVSVKNTEALPVDNADIKYYAGAWRPFGITVGGEAVKELLPANLSFRASYNGSQKDKVQNTAENNTVEFVFP